MARPRELVLRNGLATHRVRVVSDGVVEVGGRRVAVDVSAVDESSFVVTADGARHTVSVASDGERTWAMAGGEAFEVEGVAGDPSAGETAGFGLSAAGPSDGEAGGASTVATSGSDGAALSAPMPATVTAVLVRPGDRVDVGDAVVRLEAMKMELVVTAPRAGRVAAVGCREGDLVQPGRPLVTLEGDPDEGRPAAGRS